MTSFIDRLAGAPISWGVCEAPGWGMQLTRERVLAEAQSLGLKAMEQGALGWMPDDPAEEKSLLDSYGLQLIGGFVPLVLHDHAQRDDALAMAEDVAAQMSEAGGSVFITAVVAGQDDWSRPHLDDAAWTEMFVNLEIVDDIVAAHGLVQAAHPHIDTLIETADEFQRFLDSCDVKICFDIGHLTIGGADVVAIARDYSDRMGLVHLKDVDGDVAARERSGELDLMAATQAGLFPALGDGIVPIAEVVEVLEDAGYQGWYTMETDQALTDGEPTPGEGPVLVVARGIDFLRSLDIVTPAGTSG